jgi:hypothetical protein
MCGHRAPNHRKNSLASAAIRWLALAAIVFAVVPPARAAEEAAAIEKRLSDATHYLASDELEGRGPGTKGLDLAAEYIARQFAQAGLKTEVFDGKPFQKFSIGGGAEVGKDNRLLLAGPAKPGEKPQSVDLVPGRDFTPLAVSGTANFDLPLVFAGYGITGKAEEYDDYQGLDVTGKAVILLRHEPRQDDPNSAFDGTRDSRHASIARKLANAREHKAAAVIFCTDELEIRKNLTARKRDWHEAIDRLAAENEKLKKLENPTPEELETQHKRIEVLVAAVEAAGKRLQEQFDPLLDAAQMGSGRQTELPVIHCRRAALDRAVRAALGTDLATLEHQIDQGPAPHSKELAGWRAAGKTDVRPGQIELRNVVAVLEGEGPAADETIVVGAHYDHVGLGGSGGALGPKGVYHGADDNASGTAVLMEVARSLALRHEKLPRRVVFAAFSGEERGILGSRHYTRQPPFPMDKTVAMVNLDMVGRLRDDKLSVMGSTSGKQFAELLGRLSPSEGLKLNLLPGGPGPSDQMPFHQQGVPVIHFFTGMHGDYHRTSDTADKLNVPGMRRIARVTEAVVLELAKTPSRPEFVKTSSGSGLLGLLGGKRPPFFGIVPAEGPDGSGFALGSVLKGGPAEKAGLRSGDVIVEFGGAKITTFDGFLGELRKHKAGEKVKTVVRRGTETVTVELTLDPAR